MYMYFFQSAKNRQKNDVLICMCAYASKGCAPCRRPMGTVASSHTHAGAPGRELLPPRRNYVIWDPPGGRKRGGKDTSQGTEGCLACLQGPLGRRILRCTFLPQLILMLLFRKTAARIAASERTWRILPSPVMEKHLVF